MEDQNGYFGKSCLDLVPHIALDAAGVHVEVQASAVFGGVGCGIANEG